MLVDGIVGDILVTRDMVNEHRQLRRCYKEFEIRLSNFYQFVVAILTNIHYLLVNEPIRRAPTMNFVGARRAIDSGLRVDSKESELVDASELRADYRSFGRWRLV